MIENESECVEYAQGGDGDYELTSGRIWPTCHFAATHGK